MNLRALQRRRSFQEDAANEAAHRLQEAASPSPQLRFTDIEALLRRQLNCTEAEFRAVWQGGYDCCEEQQQLLQQLQQQQQNQHLQQYPTGAIGAEQQQMAVLYVQQLDEKINNSGGLWAETHDAAAAAAAADEAAEAQAEEGDDRTEAGLKQLARQVDPFAGPPSDLAPPTQIYDVPAMEGKPPLSFWETPVAPEGPLSCLCEGPLCG